MAVARGLPRLFDLAESEIRLMGDLQAAYEQDPPDEAAMARIAAEFVGNEALVVRKIENYLNVDLHLGMIADSYAARARELRELSAIAERNRDRLRARLLAAMKAMQRDTLVTPSGSVSIRSNPPHVDVLEEMLIPSEFKHTVVTTTIDKRSILESVKQTGLVPPGVEVVRGERLSIA